MKRIEIKIVVDVPEDHDEKDLVDYVVGGMRADQNLSLLRFIRWEANDAHETLEHRYGNRLDMTLIALEHCLFRHEMGTAARSWLTAEAVNIRKALGQTEETR